MFDPLPEFARLRTAPFGQGLIVGANWGVDSVDLVCFGIDQVASEDAIGTLARWRAENNLNFTQQGPVTPASTKSWALAQLVNRPDRILFLVREAETGFVGHMGLSSVNMSERSGEFDNIVRGDKTARRGVMVDASRVLLRWAYDSLAFEQVWVKTFWDNFRAVSMYHRAGFVPVQLYPLQCRDTNGVVNWVDAPSGGAFNRFLAKMIHRRETV